jgi:N-sulfoglucosamine sulfohydrolase
MFRFFILFIVLSAPIASSAQQQVSVAPNIIWIVSEDNSPFLGAYGDSMATTPHLNRLAGESILYENAFAVAPVCSPSRSTLITGVYATSMGTEHMRSKYPIPAQLRFFPEYLKKTGYYTVNNAKTDYNTSGEQERMAHTWDESSPKAHYKNRAKGQPFFAIFNLTATHESSIFNHKDELRHRPEKVKIPPYLPPSPEMKHDLAQYYDNIEDMDSQVGRLLQELEQTGLSENTIVFYFSDHGGILGRSKQYLYDSGLRVPLLIRIPPKLKHLSDQVAPGRSDRLVSLVDFAPTMLSITGIPIPTYMEGSAFLGKSRRQPREYVYFFRGRMDERNDMSRAVRDKQFFYTKNYMPHRIYGQHIQYHWEASSIRSWERAFKAGQLNEIQSRFWREKEPEELYDVKADPHSIHNLANDPKYAGTLQKMRSVQSKWAIEYMDAGFLPEPTMEKISRRSTLYEYVRSGKYSITTMIAEIDKMLHKDKTAIRQNLQSTDPALRYWAATACSRFSGESSGFENDLKTALKDNDVAVRLAACEALYRSGQKQGVVPILLDILKTSNAAATLNALDALETMGDDAIPSLKQIKDILLYDEAKIKVFEIRAAAVRLMEKLSNK